MNNNHLKLLVWDKERKKILPVFNIHYGMCEPEKYPEGIIIDTPNEDDTDVTYLSLNDVEIIKCTGREDINGKLIFSGHVVENPKIHGKKWVIEYRMDSEFVGFVPVEIGKKDLSLFTNWKDLIIIGHIFENPELLNMLSTC